MKRDNVKSLLAKYRTAFPFSIDMILNDCCPENDDCNLDRIGGWLQNLEEMLQWKEAKKRKKLKILQEMQQIIEKEKKKERGIEKKIEDTTKDNTSTLGL